tara:strand:+ start:128 stop:841 length:714 start_codon:yes stop_codon:yes gene_type:complete
MIIPFYTSSGEAKKLDGVGKLFGVGEFFPFWGYGPNWLNKTNYTWKKWPEETAIANDDRSKYYGSTKLRRIANELDAMLPDFKAMVNQMENQIPSENISYLTRSNLINKLASREFGVKDEEFNRGLIANGIVPVRNTKGSGREVAENIRKAKKIIGVDGPITYKLVPFQNGHNFAYRPIPHENTGRFFVLVDIKPKFTIQQLKDPQERIKIRQTWKKKKKDNVVQLRNPGGEDDEWW